MNTKNVYTKDIVFQLISNKLKLVIALFFIILFTTACKIACAISFANIIEELFVLNNYSALSTNIIVIVIALTLGFGLSITKKKQLSNLGAYISTNLVEQSYNSMLCSEMNEIEKNDIDIDKIVTSSKNIGEKYISENVFSVIDNAIYLFATFITLLIIKPALGLIAYIGLPIVLIGVKGIEKILVRFEEKSKNICAKSNRKIECSLEKIKDIKLDNSINYERDKLAKISEEYIDNYAKKNVLSLLKKNLWKDLLLGVVLAIVIGVGGWLANQGSFGITAKVLTIFIVTVPEIYNCFKSVIDTRFMPSFISEDLEVLDEIINFKTEMKSELVNTIDEIHSLKFTNVGYSSDNYNFKNVNFELKRGEKLGIFSVDDNFKEGMFNIITKIEKPKDGFVSINNCDITKINTPYLRDLITSIYDKSVVFENTIMNNISYPFEFDEYKYNDALNKSGLKDEILKLEYRENTVLNDNSEIDSDLVHRIIYANAFYKDSKIFVLKDATKDYSVTTENHLLKEVFKLKNKIIIIMTDKIYNLVGVDKVLIYENGEVVEYGKYDELIRDKASRLYKLVRKPSTSRSRKIS